MSDFAPGIESMREAGIKVVAAPYPEGRAGIRLSLETMAQKMREGRNDSRVKRWAVDVLRAAGFDGRGRASIKEQLGALLDAYRAQTMYVQDPVNTEYIASAAATLCLDPNLCTRGGDCDDGVVALGSATLALGWPTWIVKQTFGGGAQEHVLLAVEDEHGNRIRADPSTRLPVGESVTAQSEEWIDPMQGPSASGTSGAEIVTLGRIPRARAYSHVLERGRVERQLVHRRRRGLGATMPPGNWVAVDQSNIQGGLRYVIGIIAPAGWTSIDVERFFDADWLVAQVQPGDVKGGLTSWVVEADARHNLALTDTPDVKIAQVLGEAAANPGTPGPNAQPPSTPPPTGGISLTTVLFSALGIATVAGIGVGVYRMRKKAA